MTPDKMAATALIALYGLSIYIFFSMVWKAFQKCGSMCDPLSVFVTGLISALVVKACIGYVLMEYSLLPSEMRFFVVVASFALVDIIYGAIVMSFMNGIAKVTDLRFVRRIPVSKHYVAMGIIIIACGVVMTIYYSLPFIGVFLCGGRFTDFSMINLLTGFALSVLVSWAAFISMSKRYFRYSKIFNEIGRTMASLEINNPPILLLRSFAIDSQVGSESFDEYICSRFRMEECPVISLCDPSHDVPSGGSLKIQAKDDSWKNLIMEILPSCRAVVMIEGVTAGLNWEIGKIKEFVPHDRFFILTPPEKFRIFAWFSCPSWLIWFHKLMSRKPIEESFLFVWTRFRETLKGGGIEIISNPPESNSIIAFDEDWKASQIVMPKDAKDAFGTILSMIPSDGRTEVDYTKLAQKIKMFERCEDFPDWQKSIVASTKRTVCFLFGLFAAIALCFMALKYVGEHFLDDADFIQAANETAIKETLSELGVAYEFNANEHVIAFDVGPMIETNKDTMVVIVGNELVYTVSSHYVLQDVMTDRLLRILFKINAYLAAIGDFSLDMEDGAIVFRHCIIGTELYTYTDVKKVAFIRGVIASVRALDAVMKEVVDEKITEDECLENFKSSFDLFLVSPNAIAK